MKLFAATAIGSVPYKDPKEAVDSMRELHIPAYPQMVGLSPWEDMFLGALEGLPGLIVDRKTQTVRARRANRENELADFYAAFLKGERDFLALAPGFSRGFEAFLKRAAQDPTYGPDFLKIQVIGPLTFGQMVLMEDEAGSLVDDLELLEVMALALGGKASWEASKIRALGRTPVVFIDEPGLTSFGSAFSTLTADTVVKTMGSACETVRADGSALIGCHVCGNTDWGLMMDTDIDIVNFDAFAVMEQFSLYPKQIRAFLERGGYIAWGIVPSQGFSFDLTAEFLADKLDGGWRGLDRKGVPYELLASRAVLATACGLGMLKPNEALAATSMTTAVSREMSARTKGLLKSAS
jgi:hypothetical protein